MQAVNDVPLVADNDIVINNAAVESKNDSGWICVFFGLMLFLVSLTFCITAIAWTDLTDIKIVFDPPSNLPQNYVNCNDHYSGTTTHNNAANYYIFTVTQNDNGGSVLFDTCNSSYDAQLHLYHSNWTLIAKCDKCSHCIAAPIYEGKYYIKISSNVSEYGNYQLQITCSDGYITPSPTIFIPNTPDKALLGCGYNGVKEIFYGRDYFFCGSYDEFCAEWSILCSMKNVANMWLILGVCATVMGSFAIFAMFYGCNWKNLKEFKSKIIATVLMVVYLIICVANIIIYKESSTCYDEYCSKVSAIWGAEYYKCDFEDDGGSMFSMYMAIAMGILGIFLYIMGRTLASVFEKWQKNYNGKKQAKVTGITKDLEMNT